MSKIAILYGSSSNNTENVAQTIADKLQEHEVELFNVANILVSEIDNYPNLILGTSTWGLGELQDDWDDFLPKFASSNLSGKTIALFGLGDAVSYPNTFVDGIGLIYNQIKSKEIKVVGQTERDAYNFDDSQALENGNFVGLPIDEDNEMSASIIG